MHDTLTTLRRELFSPTAAVVAALAVSAAFVESGKSDTNPLHHGMESIAQLPGYDIGINSRAKRALESASVIVENYTLAENNPSEQFPSGWCSGDVVSYGNKQYVAYNAHCAGNATGKDNGVIGPRQFFGGEKGAINFIDVNGKYTYVEDVRTAIGGGVEIGLVVGMDVSTECTDSALLEVKPIPQTPGKTGLTAPSFREHKPLPYMENPTLVPGQEVALYSSPGSNPRPVSETGRYIGKVTYSYTVNGDDRLNVPYYVVVTDPKTKADDAGYWGASGSKFAAEATNNGSTTGMHGQVVFSSGGLSHRYAIRDAKNPDAHYDLASEEKAIKQIEHQTEVKIPKDDVVLIYSDPSIKVRRQLLNNFGNLIIKG